MNMEGRPDLVANRIAVMFPETSRDEHRSGFTVTTTDTVNNPIMLARGWANGRDNTLRVESHDKREINAVAVADTYDINELSRDAAREQLAKRCIAATLFDYVPVEGVDNPGINPKSTYPTLFSL